MQMTDVGQIAAEFRALYRRWDGDVPLDDLLEYQRYYASLSARDRQEFVMQVLELMRAPLAARQSAACLDILWAVRAWFPRDANGL